MTSAWTYYVTSNNFLNELRGLTRSYPFSSALLNDARWRVENDPESNRSWNLAWLCLSVIVDEYVSFLSPTLPSYEWLSQPRTVRTALTNMMCRNLISTYANHEASQPEMWGGRYPEQEEIEQLAACLVYEWERAVDTMLRHWDVPPTTTGY